MIYFNYSARRRAAAATRHSVRWLISFYNAIKVMEQKSSKEINKHRRTHEIVSLYLATCLSIYLFFIQHWSRKQKSIEKSFSTFTFRSKKFINYVFFFFYILLLLKSAREHFSTICKFCAIFGSNKIYVIHYLLNIWGYELKTYFFLLFGFLFEVMFQ